LITAATGSYTVHKIMQLTVAHQAASWSNTKQIWRMIQGWENIRN